MIFIDDEGYPVNETMDGMDSAVREGILQITQPEEWKKVKDPESYESKGFLYRHPLQSPADNEWNNTRDNMIPMIAALYACGKTEAIRRVFWKVVKRGCLSQSFDRDVRWSRKLPYPHYNYKDSRPTPESFPWWKKDEMLDEKFHPREFSWFNWADPFLPDHMAMLIKATKYKWLYPLMLPGLLWLELSFLFKYGKSQADVELNQLFCQCYVLGPYWLKKILALKDWELNFRKYWYARNEAEYADFIIGYLKKL